MIWHRCVRKKKKEKKKAHPKTEKIKPYVNGIASPKNDLVNQPNDQHTVFMKL